MRLRGGSTRTGGRGSRWRLRALVAAVIAVLVVGCTPSRREVRTDIVRRIRFVGNGGPLSGHNGLQLRRAMATKQSPPLTLTFPFLYFLTPATLSREALAADTRRLEVWYAHHGWFDARFEGWQIRRARAASPERAGVVDLIGHVVPGPRSSIRTLDVTTSGGRAVGLIVRNAVRASEVVAGDPFDLDTIRFLETTVLDALRDRNYAYATSTLRIDAFPEQQEVDVALHVEPGVVSRFGPVSVTGLVRVPEANVRAALRLEDHGSYRVASLRDAQRRLFDTGLFSLVDIQPDLSDPANPDVPVKVRLVEGRLRRFRTGVGVTFDYFIVSPRLSLRFDDHRLFGTDVKFTAEGGVGAIIGVVRDDASAASDVLPTGLVALRFEDPWFVGGRLGLSLGGSFRQDAQFGDLPYWRAGADLTLSYRFSDAITLAVGPTFDFWRYLAPSAGTLEAARLQFGGDFQGAEYRLLALDAKLRLDYRDDPIRTRRGTFWGLDVRQSLPIPSFATALDAGVPDRGFLYTRVDGEVRGFVPVRTSRKQKRFPFVVGGRLHAVGLLPWRAGDALPYPDLAFLGGPNSLRGFRSNQVGPYDTLCTYAGGRPTPQHANGQAYEVARTYLPRGGALALEGSGEVRYDWKYGVSFAAFGDVGLLARRWNAVSADQLRAGGGVGLRLDTPVGPIRLDVGLRPVYAEDAGPVRSIGCNPVDRLPRGFDLLTGGIRVRETLTERQFPLAINLFLAIGEAF